MTNFGDIEKKISQYDTSKIVITPVPYDETSTWGKGADQGPEAIIEASANMELYDIETGSQVFELGIHTDSPIVEKDENLIFKEIENRISEHIHNKKFPILLGGEHSISIGSIKAHAKKNNNLSVLQLDAHADLRDSYLGSKNNHGCIMARVQEICPAVQVGIRSMSEEEKEKASKNKIFFAKDIHNQKEWIQEAVNALSENVYITIDLDVFDPAIMPSTGTPEPGGLLWYDVLSLLKQVAASKNIVGFDVVELCPNPQNKAPDFLAAKLIYKLLSYIFKGQQK